MHLNITQYEEHPFAQYVRILGKGKRGSRSLTEEEAFNAMRMILCDEADPLQVGAFLMLLRVKEESPEELSGFIKASKQVMNAPDNLAVDLDWSSYAGKRRHLPWFVFAIFLLAEQGTRVFVHGTQGHTINRLYTETVLEALGYPPAQNWQDAAQQIDNNGFCYMPLGSFLPKMEELIQLRPILGLRSPVHSLSRLLNPANAPCVLQGIFHPPYAPLHQSTGALLQYPCVAVIKGEGGEIEINPDNECQIHISSNQRTFTENLPAQFTKRHLKAEALSLDHMLGVWRNTIQDEYAEGAVTSTLALALYSMNNALSMSQALDNAKSLWHSRDRSRF
jgi:anthranilate phosphoribosyltransferase